MSTPPKKGSSKQAGISVNHTQQEADMRTISTRMAILAMAIFYLAGCASVAPRSETPDRIRTVVYPKPANSYYFFTEAQLWRMRGDLKEAIDYLNKALELDPDSVYLQRDLAVLHIQSKDNAGALAVLEKLFEKAPEDVDALTLYGRIKQNIGKTAEAKETYEKILTIDPGRKTIYRLLGGLYMQDDQQEEALKAFEQLVEIEPGSYSGYYFMGRIFAKRGETEAAEKAFKKALSLEPGLLEARFELVDIYKAMDETFTIVTAGPGETLKEICLKQYDRFDERIEKAIRTYNPSLKPDAEPKSGDQIRMPSLDRIEAEGRPVENADEIIALYKEILRDTPRNIQAAMELGHFYHRTGRIDSAMALFEELGRRSGDEFEVILRLVQLYIDPDRFEDAIPIIEGMLVGAPDNPELHHLAGLAFSGLEESDLAISHFKRVKPKSRFFEDATLHMAYLFQEAEKLEEATRHLEEACRQNPDNIEFKYYLAALYEEQENYPEAEAILKGLLTSGQDTPKLHFRLGVIFDKAGKKEACIEEMKTVIRLDPKHANGLNYLGYTYAEMGRNLDEAERLVKEALVHKPNDGYITDSLGWIYYKKGRYKDALIHLKKASELAPEDPIIMEHVGDVYLKLGDKSNALQYYKRSLANKKKETESLEKKIRNLMEKPLQ